MSTFTMGLDLGQAGDYTAIVITEHIPARVYGEFDPNRFRNDATPEFYHVRHLERLKLGTTYVDIAKHVKALLLRAAELRNATLVVDVTGTGTPVVDMLRASGLQLTPVLITGGDKASRDGLAYYVPKRDLVVATELLLESGKLKISDQLPFATTLIEELLSFKSRSNTQTAHDSYEAWREGAHDDLVLALALSCWQGAQGSGWTIQDY
jgi:hypothetical protein